jgi:hypothetical protein
MVLQSERANEFRAVLGAIRQRLANHLHATSALFRLGIEQRQRLFQI